MVDIIVELKAAWKRGDVDTLPQLASGKMLL